MIWFGLVDVPRKACQKIGGVSIVKWQRVLMHFLASTLNDKNEPMHPPDDRVVLKRSLKSG